MELKEIFKSLDFFKHLSDDALESLSLHVNILDFGKDEILFYENETKEKFFYLLDGELKFYKVDRFDNEIFLYCLTCNNLVTDFINTHDLTCKPCFANAVFSKKSRILCIEHEFFVDLVKKDFKLYKNFIKESTDRIKCLEHIITRDVVFDGTAKIACMIVNNLKRFNELKKHEIAYELHIQPETLSRILAKMVRNKLISIEKNKVSILNLSSLKEIYE